MLVFEILAGVLVLAAIVQAVRTGLQRNDWLGVGVIVGIVVLAVAFYWVLKTGEGSR